MYEVVEKFLAHLSDLFSAGDVDGVLDRLTLPTAIYFADDMILLRNREDLACFMSTYMSGMGEEGLSKGRLTLNLVTVSDDEMITAIATAPMLDARQTPVAVGRTKYFLRNVGGALKVELVEHSRVPLEEDAVHARLAPLAV